MCKRSTGDPLVRAFLDRYNVNLLALPRRDTACMDLFRRDSEGRVSTAFDLDTVVVPELGRLDVESDEPLSPLEGKLSETRDIRLGLSLLEGFFAALGAPGLIDSLSAGYSRSKVRSLAFEFRSATRDSIDAGSLGNELIGRRFRDGHPLIIDESSYFVVTGVIRSRGLTVHAAASTTGSPQLDVEALKVAGAHAGVDVRREADSAVTYEGDIPLAVGIELYELFFDESAGRFLMKTPKGPLHTRGAAPADPEPAYIGVEGDAFVAVDGERLPAPR